MVIEKVHGLRTTNMSMNERFTLLASVSPTPMVRRPRRRQSVGSYFNQNNNFNNRNIARRLEMQAKRQAVKQRLGSLRRFGSESNLPGLRRSSSFGNLSQFSFNNRNNWRQSNGNLSRAASFGNLSMGAWSGQWRRGGNLRMMRGRFRGGHQRAGRARRGARGGRARGRQARPPTGRSRSQKPVPSREELDLQLDQYMACTKAALDRDLDQYMNNAMQLDAEF